QLGQLCLRLLVEHVRDEAERLSSLEGKPLSQASTASRTLRSQIGRTVHEYLWSDYRNEIKGLPAVVVERLIDDPPPPRAGRDLCNLESLQTMQMFWSVESRLVDSLGTISRDLGRELSLHEFTTTLAPDRAQ